MILESLQTAYYGSTACGGYWCSPPWLVECDSKSRGQYILCKGIRLSSNTNMIITGYRW
jgi:hypothetical protein